MSLTEGGGNFLVGGDFLNYEFEYFSERAGVLVGEFADGLGAGE